MRDCIITICHAPSSASLVGSFEKCFAYLWHLSQFFKEKIFINEVKDNQHERNKNQNSAVPSNRWYMMKYDRLG